MSDDLQHADQKRNNFAAMSNRLLYFRNLYERGVFLLYGCK